MPNFSRSLTLLAVLFLTTTAFAADPPLGLGFLWYPRSEAAAARLTAESDFVDVILGGDKLKVFDSIRPPARVICISLALQRTATRPFPGVKETIDLLRGAQIDPQRVIIGYNPERAPGTTAAELDNLLQSVQQAKAMADVFGSPLLVGPGLREMQQREELYPKLAQSCDYWLIQSQRLQMEPGTRAPRTPAEYRAGVERIVGMLRQGNPDVKVIVQLIGSGSGQPDRFTADELVAYIRAVEDLVHGIRLYGGSPELLNAVIDQLRPPEVQ
ncbi:MAG: HAD family hydrolase [Armatimonadota bacterium]